MTSIVETVDHDEGRPPLYMGAVPGFLALVLIDGHRWVVVPPGDAIAQYMVGAESEVPHERAP